MVGINLLSVAPAMIVAASQPGRPAEGRRGPGANLWSFDWAPPSKTGRPFWPQSRSKQS